MAQEIAFKNGRISNFKGLATLTLDRAILNHASLIDRYLHAKFHGNQKNFSGRTDVRTDRRTFETGLLSRLRQRIDLKTPEISMPETEIQQKQFNRNRSTNADY